jgi:hypothetical protein
VLHGKSAAALSAARHSVVIGCWAEGGYAIPASGGDVMWPLGARQLWRSCHLAVISAAGCGDSIRKKIYSNANTRFQLLLVVMTFDAFFPTVIA